MVGWWRRKKPARSPTLVQPLQEVKVVGLHVVVRLGRGERWHGLVEVLGDRVCGQCRPVDSVPDLQQSSVEYSWKVCVCVSLCFKVWSALCLTSYWTLYQFDFFYFFCVSLFQCLCVCDSVRVCLIVYNTCVFVILCDMKIRFPPALIMGRHALPFSNVGRACPRFFEILESALSIKKNHRCTCKSFLLYERSRY